MSRRRQKAFFRSFTLASACTAALRDRRGVTLVIYALTLPVILGFVGLAVEAGDWYTTQAKLQTAADAGALAGAWEIKAGGTSADAIRVATEAIDKNSAAPSTITINTPPTSGPYAGNKDAVQVSVSRQALPLFSAVFSLAAFNISASAVASLATTSDACVLALDPSNDPGTVTINGTATISLGNCVMASNSSNPTDAVLINGNADFTAQSIVTVGNYETNGNVSVSLSTAAQTGADPVADPFANLDITSPAGCDHNGTQMYSGNVTLQPGTYCGGMMINSTANVTLEPGTYYIDGGNLTINGNTTTQCDCSAAGSGVTFVFTNQGGDGMTGTVTVNGGATVDLPAPTNVTDTTNYPYPGMLFVQDRNAPYGQNATFNGNVSSVLQGALYFPNGEVVMNGNYSNNANCTSVIGWHVLLNGNVGYSTSFASTANCDAASITPIAITDVKLVE